jgi:phosphoribosylaminoimidazolecarboxamide formyltransferase/IMP cyclohydrolase
LPTSQQLFPEMLAITGTRREELRYGENPHQRAALYLPKGPHGAGIAQAEQVQGKELSYNNYNDADAALELVSEFRGRPADGGDRQARQPVRRGPGRHAARGLERARCLRRVSAFGGIVAVNVPLDGATAEAICEIFTEVVVAPGADDAAKAAFAKKKNLRLLLTGDLPDPRAAG